MHEADITKAMEPVVQAFDSLGIPYYVVGSIASSAYGTPRATLDVDIIAGVRSSHVSPLVKSLEGRYYIVGDMILEAIARRSTFNLIHLETMVKVDVFVARDDAYQAEAFKRTRSSPLAEGSGNRTYNLASLEDVIIGKLMWYEEGGRASEQQWGDVIGMIRVQGDSLDMNYLKRWSKEMGVAQLLEQVFRDSEGRGR